jgi:hypothetical protein
MSRGLGKVQRDLLVILREHDETASPQQAAEGLDTIALAGRVHFGQASFGWMAEQTAVRRALAGLARRGLVFRLGALGGDRCHWRVPPPDMVVAAQRRAKAGVSRAR